MNTENLNLTMVEKSRSSITNSHDLQVYDFEMFSNCHELLRCLERQVVEFRQCDSLEYNYDTIKNKYKKMMVNLNPIMKLCYKGYKSYCECHGISYTVMLDYKD